MPEPIRTTPRLYQRIIATSISSILALGHLALLFVWYILALENEPGGPNGWNTPVKVYTKVFVSLLAILTMLVPLAGALGWQLKTIGIYALVVVSVWIIYLLFL